MAKVYRFPVCYWNCSPRTVTARLVDDGYTDVVVTAANRKEALGQIKDYLQRLSKTNSWKLYEPDFLDPEQRVLKLSVLPEYEQNNRTYPCRETVKLRLPCIVGRRTGGSPVAALPTLGVFFDFHRDDAFQQLATHVAQRALSGSTPAELSRFLPPEEFTLEQLAVTLREGSGGREPWEKQLAPLTEVADPVGSNAYRRAARTWEREKEVGELTTILGEAGSSVALVGESGCGKTAVLMEAARQIERSTDGERSQERRLFWMTSGGRLVAGMRWLGQWQERLEQVIERLASIRGILCLEDLMELIKLGGQSPESSLASFIIPYLDSGELRIVAELTPSGLDACDRLLPGLVDRLRVLKLEDLAPEKAQRVVTRAADYFSRNDSVAFGPDAARRAHDLFQRFQPYVAFPGKLMQFMGSLVDNVRQTREAGLIEPDVGTIQVEDHFAKTAGLPDFLVRDGGQLDFDAMRTHFARNLFAQDEAVESVCRAVAKFAAGLNDPNRPIAVLLFCGPTGVGKTQLVRLLGDFLFPNRPEQERLVRLDMSEYSGPDASHRLLGSQFGESSNLVRRMRANPFGVLLLDEIEKASDEVFDIFLNLFEEGRLCDAMGRVTSFQSSLIIMTSNLGAGQSGVVGFHQGDPQSNPAGEIDRNAVTHFFRPEFFNRLDQVVWFRPLGLQAIKSVVAKELNDLSRREGLAARTLQLKFDDQIAVELARTGFDALYGARPLQRAIDDMVTRPLGRFLARQPELHDCTIQVSWAEGGAHFQIV